MHRKLLLRCADYALENFELSAKKFACASCQHVSNRTHRVPSSFTEVINRRIANMRSECTRAHTHSTTHRGRHSNSTKSAEQKTANVETLTFMRLPPVSVRVRIRLHRDSCILGFCVSRHWPPRADVGKPDRVILNMFHLNPNLHLMQYTKHSTRSKWICIFSTPVSCPSQAERQLP